MIFISNLMNKFNFSHFQLFIITIIAVFFTLGCSDNDNTLSTNNLSQKIEVEKSLLQGAQALSKALLKLTTSAYYIKYTNSGQRLFLTYPVKTDNLMWQI